MARGHTGAALVNHFAGAGVRKQPRKFVAQLLGGLEASLFIQIQFEKTIDGARNVARDGVHSFILAGITIGRAGIDELHSVAIQMREDKRRIHRQHTGEALKNSRFGLRQCAGQRAAFRDPKTYAAIQHGHRLVPQPAQQPPEPRRVYAALRIAGDDLRRLAYPQPAQLVSQFRGNRQRMAAVLASLSSGQILIEMEEMGAREVGFCIGAPPGCQVEQVVPAIADDPVGVIEVLRHDFSRNKGPVVHCYASSPLSHASAVPVSSNTWISEATKSCDSQALQIIHWSVVITATLVKSSAC